MKIIVHDFSGHPFQVHLSRALAKRGFSVLHVYSQSFQTPKGALEKKGNDPDKFNIVGISQKGGFPKYSFIRRWFAESDYSRQLIAIVNKFKPDAVISSNAPLDVQHRLYRQCKKMGGVQFIFWVQDIYSIGMIHALKKKLPVLGRLIALYYTRLEKYLLNQSDHIVLISHDFKPIIKEWVRKTSISVVENWAPLDEIRPNPKSNPWSISQGFSDKFCFMYSGTLGLKHNPTLLLELARHYRHDENVVIAIVSEGIGAEWLQREASLLGLTNLRFYNYFNYNELPTVLSSADVLLAILEKNAGNFCVPSKVLSYHCIGRPLLLSVPKENLASRIVISSHSGLVVEPDDANGFCACADLLKTDGQMRYQMGQNAFNFARHAFDIDKKCDSFIRIFR